MTKPIRIGFYLRSATGNLVGLRRQFKALIKELPTRGFNHESCIIEIFRDTHQSGMRAGPEFQRLLQDIRSGRVNVVMVSRMNRISRKPSDLKDFYKFVSDHAIRFISAHENVDTLHWQPLQPSIPEGIGLSNLA
jgi:DNA invertase Pin-like site-specific DNA recombinase